MPPQVGVWAQDHAARTRVREPAFGATKPCRRAAAAARALASSSSSRRVSMVRAWVSMTRACRLMLVGGAFESFGELGDVFLGGFVQAECGDDLRPGVALVEPVAGQDTPVWVEAPLLVESGGVSDGIGGLSNATTERSSLAGRAERRWLLTCTKRFPLAPTINRRQQQRQRFARKQS